MRLTCTVNGVPQRVDQLWAGASLLHVLRERLDLPGTKGACEQGRCGSCTVLLDDEPVYACLVAAGQVQGRRVVTVEGLSGSDADRADRVRQAFIDAGAVQCGFCTPGFVVAVHHLLGQGCPPSELDIRAALAGNLCRCTGYEKIVEAVRLAAARMER